MKHEQFLKVGIFFNFKNSDSRAQVDCFIEKYLGIDGVFLLMLIAQHADVVFTTELVGALYTSHYEIEERRKALKQMDKVLPLIVPGTVFIQILR